MNKLEAMTIKSNIQKVFADLESAARGQITEFLPNSDEELIRINSNISTQYVLQFSIRPFVRTGNQIHNKIYKNIKLDIFNHTINQINLFDHPAKIPARAAAWLIASKSDENVYSRLLLLDQFTALQEIDEAKQVEIYPKMSAWLVKLIVDCHTYIKKSNLTTKDPQMEFFSNNANNASLDENKRNLRNTVIKNK